MDGTELVEMNNEMDALVAALQSDNEEQLMKLTGQGGGGGDRVGLPRLSINYDQETEDGQPLQRGDWKIMVDGEFLYAPEVTMQPLMRVFEYSMWDGEMNEGRGGFSCKSVLRDRSLTLMVATSVADCLVRMRSNSTSKTLRTSRVAPSFVIRSSTERLAAPSKTVMGRKSS